MSLSKSVLAVGMVVGLTATVNAAMPRQKSSEDTYTNYRMNQGGGYIAGKAQQDSLLPW